jgi:hypothetical protein
MGRAAATIRVTMSLADDVPRWGHHRPERKGCQEPDTPAPGRNTREALPV